MGYVRLDVYPNGLSTSGHRETPLAVFFFPLRVKKKPPPLPVDLLLRRLSKHPARWNFFFSGSESVQKSRKK